MNRMIKFPMVLGLALLVSAAVQAQYSFEIADDDHSVIQYFGSARDSKGVPLPEVTVEITGPESAYAFVTDESGRFRGRLPVELASEKMTARCSRAGFDQVRVSMRPGPKGIAPKVQVDCTLRRVEGS